MLEKLWDFIANIVPVERWLRSIGNVLKFLGLAFRPDSNQPQDPEVERVWRAMLTGDTQWARERRMFLMIPARRRCKNCLSPLTGIGVYFMRHFGRGSFSRNPRFCEF